MLSQRPWNLEGLVRLMLGMLVCISFLVLIQGITEHFAGKKYFDDGTLLYLAFNTLSLHGSVLLVTAIYFRQRQISWTEAFGFCNSPVLRFIILGAVVALVFLPVGMVLQDVSLKVMEWLHISAPPQTAVDEFNNTASPWGRAYLAFFAVFIAPLAEEILFRGLIYATVKQMGYPRGAVWFNAVVWSLIHHSAAIFVPLVVLGLALTWLYEKTNNLLAPIAAHGVFNAINIVLLYCGNYLEQFVGQHFHGQ